MPSPERSPAGLLHHRRRRPRLSLAPHCLVPTTAGEAPASPPLSPCPRQLLAQSCTRAPARPQPSSSPHRPAAPSSRPRSPLGAVAAGGAPPSPGSPCDHARPPWPRSATALRPASSGLSPSPRLVVARAPGIAGRAQCPVVLTAPPRPHSAP
nr:predicted GPI-anchored protein 58 [Aegilops tauschii subsp. strangulata]